MENSLSKKKKVLFIVEGEKTELVLLRRINRSIKLVDCEIYSYKTSIYELYDELAKDSDLELLLVLCEKESDGNKTILHHEYASIYLVFDFDPHHQKFSVEKLSEMMELFCDSTNKGKLYINYPMVESHRHLKEMPDGAFLELSVTKEEIKEYKKIVGNYSAYSNINKYDYPVIVEMVSHHLAKYNYLVTKDNRLPTLEEFVEITLKSDTDVKLMKLQHQLFKKDKLQVLNTSLFYFVDLKQRTFFKTVRKNFKLK